MDLFNEQLIPVAPYVAKIVETPDGMSNAYGEDMRTSSNQVLVRRVLAPADEKFDTPPPPAREGRGRRAV